MQNLHGPQDILIVSPTALGGLRMTVLKRIVGPPGGVVVSLGIAWLAGVLGAAVSARAADAGQADAKRTDAGTAALTTYDASSFTTFSAITAEDLLRRIPGIQALLDPPDDDAARGFGSSGSPFLFNGRRLSGKTNDPLAALKRIQARQVVRIEVIRGSVPGLDVRIGDAGLLVNVVLDDTLSSGYGSWEASAAYFTGGPWRMGGRLAYAGEYGPLAYTLAAEVVPDRAVERTADRHLLPPSASPFGRVARTGREWETSHTGTLGLTYTFANGDVANLNGRYSEQPEWSGGRADTFRIAPDGAETFAGSTLLIEDEDGDMGWEIGGDYEHTSPGGDVLRALFVVTEEKWPSVADVYRTPPGGGEVHARRQIERPHAAEKIVRGTYTWALAPHRALEVGGEVALNTHTQVNAQFEDQAGALVPVPLFNSSAEVSETRFESVSRYTWQVSPVFYAEGALDTEFSRLKQRGDDVSAARRFFFVKPRLDLRYDMSRNLQLRGRVMRTVGQLDFGDFVSSIGSDDARIGVIQAGNPDLVPEKTWTFEATGEVRLPDGQGTLSLRGFYNDIADAVDTVLIAPGVAGTGNAGDARSYGVEAKAGVRLGWLGLPTASVDVTGLLQDSAMRDPFTRLHRPLRDFQTYRWTASFRHDTAWNGLSYGATVVGEDASYASDIDYVEWFRPKPEASAFIEMRALGLTFRMEAERLRSLYTRDRFVYAGNRAETALVRVESRRETTDAVLRFIVRGTF